MIYLSKERLKTQTYLFAHCRRYNKGEVSPAQINPKVTKTVNKDAIIRGKDPIDKNNDSQANNKGEMAGKSNMETAVTQVGAKKADYGNAKNNNERSDFIKEFISQAISDYEKSKSFKRKLDEETEKHRKKHMATEAYSRAHYISESVHIPSLRQ